MDTVTIDIKELSLAPDTTEEAVLGWTGFGCSGCCCGIFCGFNVVN